MLPDLDESVSFVVDQGSPVGPIPMRSIIDSIRSGERAPDVLVWWAGATDWIAFSNDPALLDLLQDLPATNQPPPPPEPDVDDAFIPEAAETENKFPEPEVRTFDVSFDDGGAIEPSPEFEQPADLEDVASELEEVDLDELLENYPVQVEDESIEQNLEDSAVEREPSQPFFDQEAEAEADALLARDPRSMHPSASWGDDETTVIDRADVADADIVAKAEAVVSEGMRETRSIDTEAFQRVLSEQEVLETSAINTSLEDEPQADDIDSDVAQVDDVAQSDDADEIESDIAEVEDAPQGGLTGLFGSPNRSDVDGREADVDPPLAHDDATSSSLETVGARIDALTSATRRAQHGGALVIDDSELVGSDIAVELADEPEAEADLSPVISEVEVAEIEAEVASPEFGTNTGADPEVESPSGSWQAVDGEPDLEDRFSEMVRLSVDHQRRLDWALRPDELLLSSCITAIVERGFVLLDVENHDVSQRAVFDHNDDSRHIRLELSPLSPVNAAGDPVGRHVQVSVAWGREVQDADAAFATVRAHATDELTDPGTISCEANMVASSATTSVELIWAADDFVRDDHSVDRPALDASIIAILHALEARWHELFAAA